MSLLTQALVEIDHWIENSRSWHADWIRSYGVRPGLEREMIELYSEEFDFQFSEEICELYQWHDGEIRIGDMANPIFFAPLDQAVSYIVKEHFPYLPYLPLFIGDEAYYVIPEAFGDQEISPVFFFDGYISSMELKPSWGEFRPSVYAPSVTCLMQAIAECAKTYDAISAEHMKGSWKDIYPNFPTSRLSILSPIYEKYGVVGDSSGLWR